MKEKIDKSVAWWAGKVRPRNTDAPFLRNTTAGHVDMLAFAGTERKVPAQIHRKITPLPCEGKKL